jgi:hypothetical protein
VRSTHECSSRLVRIAVRNSRSKLNGSAKISGSCASASLTSARASSSVAVPSVAEEMSVARPRSLVDNWTMTSSYGFQRHGYRRNPPHKAGMDSQARALPTPASKRRLLEARIGRTDNFIQGRPDLDDTIRRLPAFAEVGADVLYAPYPDQPEQCPQRFAVPRSPHTARRNGESRLNGSHPIQAVAQRSRLSRIIRWTTASKHRVQRRSGRSARLPGDETDRRRSTHSDERKRDQS